MHHFLILSLSLSSSVFSFSAFCFSPARCLNRQGSFSLYLFVTSRISTYFFLFLSFTLCFCAIPSIHPYVFCMLSASRLALSRLVMGTLCYLLFLVWPFSPFTFADHTVVRGNLTLTLTHSIPLFFTSTFVLSLARLVGWLVGFFVDVTLDSL